VHEIWLEQKGAKRIEQKVAKETKDGNDREKKALIVRPAAHQGVVRSF
jgi:hypothetical protein